MGFQDDMEKALTVFKRPEIIVAPKQERPIEVHQPGPIAGTTYRFPAPVTPQRPADLSGRIMPPGTVATQGQSPIITDQVEFPRICSSRYEDWLMRYLVRDGRLYPAQGIRVDELRRHMQYDGIVHQTLRVDASAFGIEECPCCGAVGNNAIYCRKCEYLGRSTFLCWGGVYAKNGLRYVRCPACGNEAPITSMPSSQTGIFPQGRPK
jgi:hypothetical protein